MRIAWTASPSIDPFRRDCLMKGQDEIGLTLAIADNIGRYETAMDHPWP